MSLANVNKIISMVGRIADAKKSTEPYIVFPEKKPEFAPKDIVQPFERVRPESVGVSPKALREYLVKLEKSEGVNPRCIMILRGDKLFCEVGYGAYTPEIWQSTFSESKSVVSLAIGLLYDERKIKFTDKLVDIFPDKLSAINKFKLRDMTVRHLLTMTSEISFNEGESMTSEDWVKDFLASSLIAEIGGVFTYNSLNTYMLSAIVRERSGENISEYLDKRLFSKLGIVNYYWEKCPRGIEKGGWGLYIMPEDMAKLGLLVLNRGVWKGERIISEEYINMAAQTQVVTPESYGGYDYGYQIWTGRAKNEFLFNGMLGQNLICNRSNRIIIAVNCSNADMFQQNKFFELSEEYFGGEFADKLEPDEEGYTELCEYIKSLKPEKPLPQKPGFWQRLIGKKEEVIRDYPVECEALAGKRYAVAENEGASIGILPIILSAFQNNYTKGTREIGFNIEEGRFVLCYIENSDTFKIPVGFWRAEVVNCVYNGEPYLVAASGVFKHDENDRLVLKLRLSFLETPCERYINIYFEGDKAEVRFKERPGKQLVKNFIDIFGIGITDIPIVGAAITKFGNLGIDYAEYKIEQTFEPKLNIKLINEK